MIEQAAINANELMSIRRKSIDAVAKEKSFPLSWNVDSSKYSIITFKGYEQAYKTSDATGLQRMYYDHSKPFTKQVKYVNVFTPRNFVTKPQAYLIPQGWWTAIDLMKLNKVQMFQLKNDTAIEVE